MALLRPNVKEKAKNETYVKKNVVISGNIAQLPGECNLCNVSEQACLCSCSISKKGLITLVTKIQFLHAKWYSHSSFRCVFLKNVANSSALMMRKVAWFLFCFHALSKMLFICSWLQTFQKTSISQWCCRLKLPKNLEQRMVKIELRLIWRLPASLPLHKRLPTCALLLNDSK